jgi:hypothetical protein
VAGGYGAGEIYNNRRRYYMNMTTREVEAKIEDEPVSAHIDSSINDFYNLMHLIEKSWVSKKYHLESKEAGYNIYDKNESLQAWIGIKENCKSLMLIIFCDVCGNILYENAQRVYKGTTMEVFDFDEDLWVYNELRLTDIVKGDSFKKQHKIVKTWINDNITEIL